MDDNVAVEDAASGSLDLLGTSKELLEKKFDFLPDVPAYLSGPDYHPLRINKNEISKAVLVGSCMAGSLGNRWPPCLAGRPLAVKCAKEDHVTSEARQMADFLGLAGLIHLTHPQTEVNASQIWKTWATYLNESKQPDLLMKQRNQLIQLVTDADREVGEFYQTQILKCWNMKWAEVVVDHLTGKSKQSGANDKILAHVKQAYFMHGMTSIRFMEEFITDGKCQALEMDAVKAQAKGFMEALEKIKTSQPRRFPYLRLLSGGVMSLMPVNNGKFPDLYTASVYWAIHHHRLSPGYKMTKVSLNTPLEIIILMAKSDATKEN